MKSLLTLVFLLVTAVSVQAQEPRVSPIKMTAVNQPCEEFATGGLLRSCAGIDALIFVHGIFGSKETFTNGLFNWPAEIARAHGLSTDVYILEYKSKLIAWLKEDIASFDEIAEAFFNELQGQPIPGYGTRRDGLLVNRPYRSVGFIAHSLGGNFVAAYLHWVKSELGHEHRARNSFLITLGTPADGSQFANIALMLKAQLGMNDKLLRSLEKDNTFVRMLAAWRRAENEKAMGFRCRPVHLYVGVEGKNMFPGMRIVSAESAVKPYERMIQGDPKHFPEYDHSRVAKPNGYDDPLYQWVDGILSAERNRMESRPSDSTLCERLM